MNELTIRISFVPQGPHPQGAVSLNARHWLKPEPPSPVQTAIRHNYKKTAKRRSFQFRYQFILHDYLNSLYLIALHIKTCHRQLFICAVVGMRGFIRAKWHSPTRGCLAERSTLAKA